MNLSALPNILTIIRFILVIPLALFLLSAEYAMALTIFVVAGVSDGIDGLLARRYGWVSRFGSIADPIADKLLMVVSYLMLCFLSILPWWLFTLILLRDLVIVGGAYTYHHLFGPFKVTPTYLSKFNTFMQIFLVVVVISALASVTSILDIVTLPVLVTMIS